MNKRKSRKNPLKRFKMSSHRIVAVPEAWAWPKKKTYTEEEIQQQQEAKRIFKYWKTIKDPDARDACKESMADELVRNYINVLKTVYNIDKAPQTPYFKDVNAVVARAVREGKYRVFYSIVGEWCRINGDKIPKSWLVNYYPEYLRDKQKKHTTYVIQRCITYWKGDNSLTREQKETLAKEYAQALYDWAREKCYMTFQPKTIPETQAHLAKLLEDNKDYIEGKRIKGVN